MVWFTGQVERDFARRSSKIPSLEDIQETLSQVDMIYCRAPHRKRNYRTWTSVLSSFAYMAIPHFEITFFSLIRLITRFVAKVTKPAQKPERNADFYRTLYTSKLLNFGSKMLTNWPDQFLLIMLVLQQLLDHRSLLPSCSGWLLFARVEQEGMLSLVVTFIWLQ